MRISVTLLGALLHLAHARMLLHFPEHAYTCTPTRMQLLMCPRDSEEVGAAFIGAPLCTRPDLRGSEATIMREKSMPPRVCASVCVHGAARNNA